MEKSQEEPEGLGGYRYDHTTIYTWIKISKDIICNITRTILHGFRNFILMYFVLCVIFPHNLYPSFTLILLANFTHASLFLFIVVCKHAISKNY